MSVVSREPVQCLLNRVSQLIWHLEMLQQQPTSPNWGWAEDWIRINFRLTIHYPIQCQLLRLSSLGVVIGFTFIRIISFTVIDARLVWQYRWWRPTRATVQLFGVSA